jgi:hypothetical protein
MHIRVIHVNKIEMDRLNKHSKPTCFCHVRDGTPILLSAATDAARAQLTEGQDSESKRYMQTERNMGCEATITQPYMLYILLLEGFRRGRQYNPLNP